MPDGFRDALETAGIHGMRVLWFERNGHAFSSPEAWSHSAVAMTSTHDLPTIAGWWHGSDITTRAATGRLGVGVQEADMLAERTDDRRALWQALAEANVGRWRCASVRTITQPIVDAALAFVAATPSPLCLPPIEDVLGIEEQPNLPGHDRPASELAAAADGGGTCTVRRAAHRATSGKTSDAAATAMRPCAQQCACNCTVTSPLPMQRIWCLTSRRWASAISMPRRSSTARPGSMHGYDVTDPTRVNAELGGETGLRSLVAALRAAGLGLIVDIVPNHMAAGGVENPWWADVLQTRTRQPLCEIFRYRLGQIRFRQGARARSSAIHTARRCATAQLPWRATAMNLSSGTTTIDFRSAPRIMRRSPRLGQTPTIRQRRRGGNGCIVCWSGSTTGSPGGAARATRSTGDGSSTSMAWSHCASRTSGVRGDARHAASTVPRRTDRRHAGRSRRWPGRSDRILPPTAHASR